MGGAEKTIFQKCFFRSPHGTATAVSPKKQIPLLGMQEVVKEEIRDEKTPDLMRKQLFFGYFSS